MCCLMFSVPETEYPNYVHAWLKNPCVVLSDENNLHLLDCTINLGQFCMHSTTTCRYIYLKVTIICGY